MPLGFTRKPAFSNVLYVTGKSDDQWFIPGNQAEGDNPNSGTMAQRLADCKNLLGTDDEDNQIGKAVRTGGTDW